MSKQNKENLFLLIKSLSKSEKRQFKLFVGRVKSNKDSKFIKLFNLLDKSFKYNELEILKKNFVTKQQLSNLKAHLYNQILQSLRMNPMLQDNRMIIREQIDYATVLYQKGLYKQSLKILDKAKNMSIDLDEKYSAFEIVEIEKYLVILDTFQKSDWKSSLTHHDLEANILVSRNGYKIIDWEYASNGHYSFDRHSLGLMNDNKMLNELIKFMNYFWSLINKKD